MNNVLKATKQQSEIDALRIQQEALTREKRQIQEKYSRVVNSKCYLLLQDAEREQHEFFSDYDKAFIVKNSSELTQKVTQLLHEDYCNIYDIYHNELIIHKRILDSFHKEILSQSTLAEADAHAEEMQGYHRDSLSKWKAKKESFINEIESRREQEVANINEYPLSESILASNEQKDIQEVVFLAGGEGRYEDADILA